MLYVAPILSVPNIEEALRYYTQQLHFDEWFKIKNAQGAITFGGVKRGHARVMFDHMASLDANALSVLTQGVTLYVDMTDEDIDALYDRIRERVAVVDPIADKYWGDRTFTIRDHVGYRLLYAKTKEVLSNEELSQRAQASAAGTG